MGRGRGARFGRLGPGSACAGLAVLTVLAGCDLGERPGFYDAPAGVLAVGDVNGDGAPDVLSVGGELPGAPAGSAVLLGDGSGKFTPTVTDDGIVVRRVVLGDVDGDRDADRVEVLENGLAIRVGDGAGAFAPPALLAPVGEPGAWVLDAQVGDLDGDGDLDIAEGIQGGLVIRMGDGSGAFTAGHIYVPSAPPSADPPVAVERLALADMDDDGDLDVVTQSVWVDNWFIHTALGIALNEGSGDFGAIPTTDLGVFASGTGRLQVGDVDEDGDVDVLSAVVDQTRGSAYLVFPGDGLGGVGAPRDLRDDVSDREIPVNALGDVTGDGHLDLVLGQRVHPASRFNYGGVLAGDGAGGFGPGGEALALDRTLNDAVDSDLDGDGHLDIVGAQPGRVIVFLNRLG
jgi:hypothetical protein